MGRKSEESDPRYNISTTPAQIYWEHIPYAVELIYPRYPRPPPKAKSAAAVHFTYSSCCNSLQSKSKKQRSVIGSKESLLCVSSASSCAPPCSDLSCSHMTGPAQNTGIQMPRCLFHLHNLTVHQFVSVIN